MYLIGGVEKYNFMIEIHGKPYAKRSGGENNG